MSTTAKLLLGTRTALTTSALNSLANVTYVNAGTITFASTSKVSLDCKLEVEATSGTVAGNKQLIVFAQQSMDGTNFETGPTSSTTTTDEQNLTFIGVLPLNSSATQQRKNFDLAAAFGGALPYACKIIIKNDSGAALAASGHAVNYTMIDGDLT